MDLIHMELIAGYTVLEVGGAVLALIVLLSVLKALKKKPEAKGMMEARCACGWRGKVGQYNRRCPRCNAEVSAS